MNENEYGVISKEEIQVEKAGGMWVDEVVVTDGNLVTSRWPMDIGAFMREMMKLAK